jgi:hypothetical protein
MKKIKKLSWLIFCNFWWMLPLIGLIGISFLAIIEWN